METAATIGAALGTSWASGINLYAAVATLGLLHRFGGIELPGNLDHLSNPFVILIAVLMYCVEFFADKIPYVDTIWDGIHTFIRVPAGAALAYSTFGDFSPAVKLIMFMVGGSVALSAHGTKAAARIAINTSPEPFSNIATSAGEDLGVFALITVVALHPIVAGFMVLGLMGLTIWILPKIIRALWSMMRKVKRLVFGGGRKEMPGA